MTDRKSYRPERDDDPGGIWSDGWKRLRRNPLGMTGAAVIIVLYLVAIFAPVLTPYDPVSHGELPAERYLSPRPEHPLGTDKFGRDVLTRVLYGARISLSVSLLAVSLSVIIGSAVGAVSGYLGGVFDAVVMRVVDALMAIPRLFLLLTCIALFSRSILLLIILLGAMNSV